MQHVKRTLVIEAPVKSWALFDALCKRTGRRPGMMFYRLLAVLTEYSTPDVVDGPEVERLECKLYGLLTEAFRSGAGRQAVGGPDGVPVAAGRVIDFARALEKLRLLHERGL